MPLDTGTWAIIFVVVVIAVVVGGAKLPGIIRNVGRSWGQFRIGKAEADREFDDFQKAIKSTEAPK